MPLSGLTLRRYQPTDFEALVQIDQSCFPKTIAYGRREMRAYLESEGSWCIVAEVDGAIAGFILMEAGGQFAHIITLDVDGRFRRRSVGSRLLQDAEREALDRGARLLYLETATTNKPAIALWEKHGYREMGTIKNYYGTNQDAYQMQKRLGQKSQARQP